MNLLVDNREFSQLDSNDGTLLAQKVKQYEDRYVFKLTCHFIDNYICDVVSKSHSVLLVFLTKTKNSKDKTFFPIHNAFLVFLTKTKNSEDEFVFSTYYDAKKVRISQEKHLLMGFPLSYQLTNANQSAH